MYKDSSILGWLNFGLTQNPAFVLLSGSLEASLSLHSVWDLESAEAAFPAP